MLLGVQVARCHHEMGYKLNNLWGRSFIISVRDSFDLHNVHETLKYMLKSQGAVTGSKTHSYQHLESFHIFLLTLASCQVNASGSSPIG